MTLDDVQIGIIGLGYVGLPLAVEFGKHFPTIGFDLKESRVAELRAGADSTLETTPEELASAKHLRYTVDPKDIADFNVYIVTVPTPIDRYKRPDLSPLEKASETLGALLKPGDVVIYESTVFPGATEEVCVPILERLSGLTYITATVGAQPSGRIPPVGAQPSARTSPADADPSGRSDPPAPDSSQNPGFYLGYSPERINPGDKVHRLTTIKNEVK